MSLALYACKSKEAQKLKANGFEICMDDDAQKINIIREDGGEVKYNNIYTKAEIDARIVLNNLDKLEGFGDVEIMPEKSIHKFTINGELEKNQDSSTHMCGQTIEIRYSLKKIKIHFFIEKLQNITENTLMKYK